jgi:CMP-N-acetylneuraminic acid synthetase
MKDCTVRRQDMVPFYRVNGAIYVTLICELDEYTSYNDTAWPYVMDAARSVDIDDILDLTVAEAVLKSDIFK